MIDIAWHETLKRTLRKQTRGGRDIGIMLPRGHRLSHHAILYETVEFHIAVNVIPTEVFVARPTTLADMGKLALELGNLHAPVQIAGDTLLTLADGPAEEVLDRLGIKYSQATERFEPTQVIAMVSFAGDFRVFWNGGDI